MLGIELQLDTGYILLVPQLNKFPRDNQPEANLCRDRTCLKDKECKSRLLLENMSHLSTPRVQHLLMGI